MNDWLHCNKCHIKVQPDVDVKMYLVECGHVLCETCIKRVGVEKCLICKKNNNFILIGKDMLSAAQPFFVPFETQLKKLLEVYNFQMQHRQQFCQFQVQKYQYAKKELFNTYHKLRAVMSENKMMRNMLLNSNRGNHPNAGGFVTNSPSITNDDISQGDCGSIISSIPPYTPVMENPKCVPGYAQRVHNYDGNKKGLQIPQHQPTVLY